MKLAVSLLLLTGVTLACTPAPVPCTVGEPVVDHEAWELMPLDADPFEAAPGDEIEPCVEGTNARAEDFEGELSYTVETDTCNWATVTQPILRPLAAGDPLRVRVFQFSQPFFLGAVAHVGVALGDEVVFDFPVEIPSSGQLIDEVIDVPRDVAEGEPIRFHIGNHGRNTWNLLNLEREEEALCEPDEVDG